ncbi:hypothetical protein LTR85_009707 [Meristemomyces frigidus]|nr:hypothetical protein LTR85_009707 [Meristemomyces frigidus]
MDEFTFQYELHQLKQQVEGMAMKHAQTPLSSPQRSLSPKDFLAQMRDLKAHLAGLDRKFTDIRDSQKRAADLQNLHNLQTMQAPDPHEASMLPPHSRLALPSAPLFWQLFTSLRTDVQGLDGRVAGLERTVSDLEDRVDGMDSLRFTPASSVASYDEAAQLAINGIYRKATSDAQLRDGHGTNTLREVHCNGERTVPPPPAHARLPSVSDLLASHDKHSPQSHNAADRFKASMLKSKADLADATIKMLHRYNGNIENQSTQLDKENAKLARTIVHLNAKLQGFDTKRSHGWRADSAGFEDMFGSEDSARDAYQGGALVDDQACVGQPAAELPDLLSAEQDVRVHRHEVQQPCHVSCGGAAFRDQELARMDELLRNAQEDLLSSEQRVLEHKEELQTVQDRHRRREEELRNEIEKSDYAESQLVQLRHAVKAKDEEIGAWRDNSHQYSQALLDYQQKLARSDEQLNAMQRSLLEFQRSEAETERILRARSEDVRGLQHFCDQKDEVVRKQEEVIARGARLMEERDDEIGALSRRCKDVVDGKQGEVRQQARLVKLLEERDAELSNIKACIAQACAMPQRCPRSWNGELKSPDKQLALVKSRLESCAQVAGVPGPADFDLIEHVASDGSCEARAVLRSDPKQTFKFWSEPALQWNPSPEAQSWSPRPIRDNRRLPNEVRRASAWAQSEQAPPEFGKPSAIGDRRSHGSPKSVRNPLRKVRYVRDGEVVEVPRSSLDSQGAFMQGQARDDVDNAQDSGRASDGATDRRARPQQTGRRGLPLDHTFLPPLPAPVPAQRMQSMLDMRSQARSEPHRGVTKHQSMQNLPRRRLQAYVETEDSAGELGGEV